MEPITKQYDELDLLTQEYEQERKVQKGDDWLPDWYMKKLAQAESMNQAIQERANQLIDRNNRDVARLKEYFELHVQNEVNRQLEAQNGKKKSVNFVTGVAGYRKVNESLNIVDMEKAIQWAILNLEPEAFVESISKVSVSQLKEHYKIKPTSKLIDVLRDVADAINKTPLYNHFISTGEIPDGCQLVEETEKFYVKPLQLQLKGGE